MTCLSRGPQILTAVQIKTLKPRERAYKIADGAGLYLLVNPNGSLLWRVKFRFHGIEKKMALGRYPDISLREAREKRDEAREYLEQGGDPVAHRKQERLKAEAAARTTFRVVAVKRPFNCGYPSSLLVDPNRGHGPFRGHGLMMTSGSGASTCATRSSRSAAV
ncbi:Arm DNA-binding domain-containing protein [Sphingobium ummariense]